jgi:predicted small lipoprotein YifL
MKRIITLTLAALMIFVFTACGQKDEPQSVGGWELSPDATVTDDAKAAFEKAMEGLDGVSYEPVALLGTQVVAGMNYCFLCEATVVAPEAKPYYSLIYVYADLQDNAEVTKIIAMDLGKVMEDGVVEDLQPESGNLTGAWAVDREGSVEADDAVLHLASQVVAGTNHCVLCKGWTLTFIYEDLQGKTEVLKSVPLDISALA